jgi:hypothetical protein
MRERKNKKNNPIVLDKSILVSKQRLNNIIDDINLKQNELNVIQINCDAAHNQVIHKMKELETIRQSVFEQQKKFDSDKIRLEEELKQMKLSCENDILKRLDYVKEKEVKFATYKADTESILNDLEKSLSKRISAVKETEKDIILRKEKIEAQETMLNNLKNSIVSEQFQLKELKSEIEQDKEVLSEREGHLLGKTAECEVLKSEYKIKLEKLEKDILLTEKERQNYLKLQNDLEESKRMIEMKTNNLTARENNIIIKERANEIDRQELLKLDANLKKIQRAVLNV